MARTGRNAKKKLARQTYSADGTRQSHSESGSDLHRRKQALAQMAVRFLDSCQRELDRRSILLGAKGCWDFLRETEEEARKLGILTELRDRTVQAAAKFFGRSRSTLLSPRQ